MQHESDALSVAMVDKRLLCRVTITQRLNYKSRKTLMEKATWRWGGAIRETGEIEGGGARITRDFQAQSRKHSVLIHRIILCMKS